jgi:hypothetical protein
MKKFFVRETSKGLALLIVTRGILGGIVGAALGLAMGQGNPVGAIIVGGLGFLIGGASAIGE